MATPVDVHVISHTHWDREWYLTREQYRLRLLDLVDGVLDRMDRDERFTFFHLDGQTIVLHDYLELRPEQEGRLRQRIGEGRLLVGPWYVMPDMCLVSGEALVRNLALGHRVALGFGAVMAAGYLPDPFGHVAQMPQVLAGFGLDSAILWRGFGGERAEYLWQGLDGTRVTLLHLPREGYCNGMRLPLFPKDRMAKEARAVVLREAERSAFGAVLLMVGVDHVEPHPALTDLVSCLDQTPGMTARLSTLPAYVEAVRVATRSGTESGASLERICGELRSGEDYANLLPGVLSTRTYLKQENSRAQTSLERWAEPASLFSWLCGATYPASALGHAWKTLLENHAHDSICGCSIDAVHDENMTRFARVLEVASAVTERGLRSIAARLPDPLEDAVRMLVVNSDAHAYSGVVEGLVDIPLATDEPGRSLEPGLLEQPLVLFSEASVVTSVTDHQGRVVSFQVLSGEQRVVHYMSRFDTPLAVRVRRLRMALWAEHVPGCGFAAFDVHLGESTAVPVAPPQRVTAGDGHLENARLRVDVGDDGTLVVKDKASGIVYKRCGELLDTGDVGDEYNYAPPAHDRAVTSAEARGISVRLAEPGPLRGSLRIDSVLPLPASAADNRAGRSQELVLMPVSARVRLDAGSSQLVWTLRVDNAARDHRLRVLFPTSAARVATVRADTAFGLVERPARRADPPQVVQEAPVSAAPVQSFVNAGDERAGATLLSNGLMEYEVLQGTREARVALTLLRCVGDLSRDDLATRRGHAGPGIRTPGAQCPGRHEFQFAMEPRGAPPAPAVLFASSRHFAAPPCVVSGGGGLAELPLHHSFLKIECDPPRGAVLSACKRADDREAMILRFFNPSGTPVRVRIETPRGLREAYRTDLRERRGEALPVESEQVELVLEPHRIQTVELRLV